MKNISTLIPDIQQLFNPNTPHVVNEENLSVFLSNLGETIKKRLSTREEGEFSLRFSKLGKKDRQLWYEANGYAKEEMTSQTYIKFLFGDIYEELLLFLAKESGHTVTDEQKEVEVEGVKGHIDAKIDGIVTDVKSASPFGFKKFKDHSLLENDPFGYIHQLGGYSTVESPGEPAAFFAIDKVSAEMTLMMLSPSVYSEYDPSERIRHLKEVLGGPIPQRCHTDVPDGKSGNMKLNTECSYCAFKKECWPSVRTFLYSSGPKYLSVVNETPRVYEVKND